LQQAESGAGAGMQCSPVQRRNCREAQSLEMNLSLSLQ